MRINTDTWRRRRRRRRRDAKTQRVV